MFRKVGPHRTLVVEPSKSIPSASLTASRTYILGPAGRSNAHHADDGPSHVRHLCLRDFGRHRLPRQRAFCSVCSGALAWVGGPRAPELIADAVACLRDNGPRRIRLRDEVHLLFALQSSRHVSEIEEAPAMHGIPRGTIAMFPALSPREVCVSVCVKFPSVKFTSKLCVFVAYRVSTCLRAETRDQHNSVTRPGML